MGLGRGCSDSKLSGRESVEFESPPLEGFFFDVIWFSPWPLSFVIVSFPHQLEGGTQAHVRHSHSLTLKGFNV